MSFKSRVISHRRFSFGAAALTLALLSACAAPAKFEKRLPDFRAEAYFRDTGEPQPVAGKLIRGKLDFTQNKGVVVVKGEITGLKPNTEYGFQVHEKEGCLTQDASDAGGYFNPTGVALAPFGSKEAHVGALPSLKADATGKALVDFSSSTISLDTNQPNGIANRALIVHAQANPFSASPDGKGSARLGCGIVRTL